jgi:hypothetical protein
MDSFRFTLNVASSYVASWLPTTVARGAAGVLALVAGVMTAQAVFEFVSHYSWLRHNASRGKYVFRHQKSLLYRTAIDFTVNTVEKVRYHSLNQQPANLQHTCYTIQIGEIAMVGTDPTLAKALFFARYDKHCKRNIAYGPHMRQVLDIFQPEMRNTAIPG